MTQPGTRVLAVASCDGEHLAIYGEGEYVGDLPIPMSPEEREEVVADFVKLSSGEEEAQKLTDFFCRSPCINLDNGRVIWGFQCWWGPVEKVQRRFPESRYDYITAPIPDENGRWTDD